MLSRANCLNVLLAYLQLELKTGVVRPNYYVRESTKYHLILIYIDIEVNSLIL